MPARPTTIAASRLVRSNSGSKSHAPPLARASLTGRSGSGEHLGTAAGLRRAHLPPSVTVLCPRVRIDVYSNEVGAFRSLCTAERSFEPSEIRDRLRDGPHGARVHGKVDGERRHLRIAVSDLIIKGNISAAAL